MVENVLDAVAVNVADPTPLAIVRLLGTVRFELSLFNDMVV